MINIGEKIGLLTLIRKEKRSNKWYWLCKCDCGNICEVSINNLQSGITKSCGCNQKVQRENMRKLGQQKLKETDLIEGTSISKISCSKLLKNNTSGITGVHWDSRRKKWVAQIEFKGIHYYLGRYDKKEEAIKARKESEEKLFKEFLKWYNEKYNKE